MGIMDRQRELYRQTAEQMQSRLEPGEQIHGIIAANYQKTFSMSLYFIGTTDRRIILQPVDRKWQPNGEPISIRREDITKASVWGWSVGDASAGEKLRTFLTTNGQEIRFEASGQKWKLMTLGGNLLENLMAGDEQLNGLNAFIGFLQSAKS